MVGVATSKVAVASNALVMIGDSPITAFDGSTAGAIVADNIYDEIVEELLTSHPWRFAMHTDEMSRLSVAPDTLWDAAYQLPSDVLTIKRVIVNDADIAYEMYGDQIYCNAASSDNVYVVHIARATEVEWPPYFRFAVQLHLSAIFALSVSNKPEMAASFETKADFQLRKARNIDSQVDTTPVISTTRFIAIRR